MSEFHEVNIAGLIAARHHKFYFSDQKRFAHPSGGVPCGPTGCGSFNVDGEAGLGDDAADVGGVDAATEQGGK